MEELNLLAQRAATDEAAFEELVGRCERPLLRLAGTVCHRMVTKSDDAWSVALLALARAVETYQPDKGNFLPYAELLARRRLIDHLRGQARYAVELPLAPESFDGPPDVESEQPALQAAVIKVVSSQRPSDLRLEIEALGQTLARYGFSFFDLADCSPKAQKTKKACALAVARLLIPPDLLHELQRTGNLPLAKLQEVSRLPRKLLERHRNYIIAAAEILSGEYPGLAEYVRFIREEMRV